MSGRAAATGLGRKADVRQGVFGIDIESCPACGGAVRIIVCIEEPNVIEKTLTHLDKKTTEPQGPSPSPCRAPPQRGLFG